MVQGFISIHLFLYPESCAWSDTTALESGGWRHASRRWGYAPRPWLNALVFLIKRTQGAGVYIYTLIPIRRVVRGDTHHGVGKSDVRGFPIIF